MAAEEVVGAYAAALFIRSEAEIRRPVVLLSGERTNVYGVLEKHFRETALPPSERFWRAVRGQWSPPLETWRPRVNGVQLKVLSGARLPESEEEWSALRAALASVRQHLRSDTSVDRLTAELRDFVGMVVAWWENRKKSEGGNTALLKRVASAGVLLGPMGLPLGKKACLGEFPTLAQVPPGAHMFQPPPGALQHYHHNGSVYAAPEIVSHPLLGAGGSGRLPERLPSGGGSGELAGAHGGAGGTVHGGGGYLQQLTSSAGDAQLFGQLFAGGGGGGGGGHSPREQVHPDSGLLPITAGYEIAELPREGSADNEEMQPPRRDGAAAAAPAAAAGGGGGLDGAAGKRFVSLNVGGHRFVTTAATLAAVDGSYFSKLARQAAAAGGGGAEFFIDRSGKIFEYVLDYLRARRFAEGAASSASALPRDERTLCLLAREAAFYRLPELAERAERARAASAAAPLGGDDGGGSDVLTTTAPDGSAHGGQQALGRLGLLAPGGGSGAAPAAAAGPTVLDALFVETGFKQATALAEAQASLLQQLNASLAAKQAEGFAVLDVRGGTERDGPLRNLTYHVLLHKRGPA